jgi:MFS family permease
VAVTSGSLWHDADFRKVWIVGVAISLGGVGAFVGAALVAPTIRRFGIGPTIVRVGIAGGIDRQPASARDAQRDPRSRERDRTCVGRRRAPLGALVGAALAVALGNRDTLLVAAVGTLLARAWLIFSRLGSPREMTPTGS